MDDECAENLLSMKRRKFALYGYEEIVIIYYYSFERDVAIFLSLRVNEILGIALLCTLNEENQPCPLRLHKLMINR